jgi:hypothetical protein
MSKSHWKNSLESVEQQVKTFGSLVGHAEIKPQYRLHHKDTTDLRVQCVSGVAASNIKVALAELPLPEKH